ncbi:MAG: hypothetical protein JOY82_13530 [Streptosporangiaceae bacterium]|nr:hypothetical protein [Streptosporangiaceae bacterium]MBV9855515.1 hypothetical protein [Streptosporangiaceae bacterium]
MQGNTVPDASGAARVLRKMGGSFGTAVLAASLAGAGTTDPFGKIFLWVTVFAVGSLPPALMLP